MDIGGLQTAIDAAWENRTKVTATTKGKTRDAVDTALELLDRGAVRVAEKKDAKWRTNQWLKKAVLLSFRLNDSELIPGGGDFPESVNQALNEAVTRINWSKDKKTLKMIFLVGDAPPHMDYKDDVMKIGSLYHIDEVRKLGGVIDYVVGTPLTKVYVLAEHPDPKQQHYLSLYKMGDGPLYSLFVPYHLVHFEVPNAIARVVLFRDSVAKPLGGPVVEVCAVAKRDLKAGETLDDYGMYMTYGEAVNAGEMSDGRYLPEGLVEGCRLTSDVAKDAVITYDSVPPGEIAVAGQTMSR